MKRRNRILTGVVIIILFATLFIYFYIEPSVTGKVISDNINGSNNCVVLEDGRKACKLGTVEIKGGSVDEKDSIIITSN